MKKIIDYINKSNSRIKVFLFISGLIIASCIIIMSLLIFMYPRTIGNSYMPLRLDTLNTYLGYLDSHIPLPVFKIDESYHMFYFYASYFGHILGITQAWQIFLIVQLIFAFVLFSFYPLIIYKITNSILLSVISPVLLYQITGFHLVILKNDITWILGWLVVIGTPLLFIFSNEKRSKKTTGMVFFSLCIILGISNVFRPHASLPLAIIFAVLAIMKYIRFENKKLGILLIFASLLLISISYVFFTDIVNYVYAINTNQVSLLQKMGPWHTIYMGLGWEPNPFNIEFLDESAYNAAKNINPEVIYCSKEYMDILKNLYLELFKSNTAYFFLTYTKKLILGFLITVFFLSAVNQGFALLIFTLLLFLLYRYFFNDRELIKSIIKEYRMLFIICIILIFGMMLYPMMAWPVPPYLIGTIAAGGMLLFFILLAVLERFIGIITRLYNKSLSNKAENSLN